MTPHVRPLKTFWRPDVSWNRKDTKVTFREDRKLPAVSPIHTPVQHGQGAVQREVAAAPVPYYPTAATEGELRCVQIRRHVKRLWPTFRSLTRSVCVIRRHHFFTCLA